jgi:hypothetical protein
MLLYPNGERANMVAAQHAQTVQEIPARDATVHSKVAIVGFHRLPAPAANG